MIFRTKEIDGLSTVFRLVNLVNLKIEWVWSVVWVISQIGKLNIIYKQEFVLALFVFFFFVYSWWVYFCLFRVI